MEWPRRSGEDHCEILKVQSGIDASPFSIGALMFSGVPNRLRECLRLGVFCALFPLFSATRFRQLFETKPASSSLLGTHGGPTAVDGVQANVSANARRVSVCE